MSAAPEVLSARPYQIGIYEQAVEENSIVYLPTGSGKTYIATLLIKKFSADVQKSLSEGGKRIVFIVNTVALVHQQSAYLSRHVGLPCKGFSGDMGVDFWDHVTWKNELEENKILVLTSQIFLNILNLGLISMNQTNLILFDECHHAVENHPMRLILQKLKDCPSDQQPRIVGLSATLLNSNVKDSQIVTHLEKLKATMHAQILTVNSFSDVKEFSTSPQEGIVQFEKPIQFPVSEKIFAILDDIKAVLKIVKIPSVPNNSDKRFRPKSKDDKLQNVIADIEENIKELGIYAGWKTLLFRMIQLEFLKKSANFLDLATVFTYIISKFILARKILDDEMKHLSEIEKIRRYSTDKLLKLFTVLKSFQQEKLESQKFCCIIFVERRFTVKVICHILKCLGDCCENFKFLKPGFMIGDNANIYGTARENLCLSKWNKESLMKFRAGTTNCLVSTSVIDEGIDIPICTLIIRFSFPRDFRAYVQSKGRARHNTSQYKILIEQNDNKQTGKYSQYKRTEQLLNTLLRDRKMFRECPSKQKIAEDMYTSDLEEYTCKDEATGLISTVDRHSAVSLIYNYCNNLYKSKFVMLAPSWNLRPRENLYQVMLKLPPVSPLSEVIMYNRALETTEAAKQATALAGCIKLHEIGELTDRLIPKTEKEVLENLDYLFPHWRKDDSKTRGTSNQKAEYKIKYADCLYSAFPTKDEELYLHVMEIKPVFTIPDENRELVFHNILNKKSGYAILSTKQMPSVPQFPLYMRVGEIAVDIHTNYSTIRLTQDQIDNLRRFHTLVFSNILKSITSFMVFDSRNLGNSFLVVPVNEEWSINWEVVNNCQDLRSIAQTPRGTLDSYADFEFALVTPNYRGCRSVYIVTQVCDDLTVESTFPTPNFRTYYSYFVEKHQLNITNPKQPLLEVKPVSVKVDFIKPRESLVSAKRKRVEDEEWAEHLVPELCKKVEFPSLYWLKATALPSILHRLTHLIVADELRTTIARDTGIGIIELQPDQKWRPMAINEMECKQLEKNSSEEDEDDVSSESSVSDEEMDVDKPVDFITPENNFSLKNVDNATYSWDLVEEPINIYDDVEAKQLIEIEYYYNFMNKSSELDESLQKSQNTSHKFKFANREVQAPKIKLLSANNPRGPEPWDILQGITCASKNDAFNLERLEMLGDSFLKFATCMFLYETFPRYNEGHLTAIKGKIVGNRNLYYCALAKKIEQVILLDKFKPPYNSITPAYAVCRELQDIMIENETCPNFLFEFDVTRAETMSGHIGKDHLASIVKRLEEWPKKSKEKMHTGLEHHMSLQVIGDKNIADSVESLIGVYLKETGIKSAMKILQWFNILPEFSEDEMFAPPKNNPIISEANPNDFLPLASVIEERIGYKFNNRGFMLQAFTHPSYTMNGITQCYERLEFLGDSLLDFLLTLYIFETCTYLTPGGLTDLRSALVNNITFACLTAKYGLHTSFLSFAPALQEAIDSFVKFQEHRDYLIDDEVIEILLEEDECKLAEHVDVPKTLGDIFESIIGAIYLDCGKDINIVWEVIYRLMHDEIINFSTKVPKNSLRLIHETQKANPKFHKHVTVPEFNSVMVPLDVTVEAKRVRFYGFGKNKKQAKNAAAKQALRFIRNMSCKN